MLGPDLPVSRLVKDYMLATLAYWWVMVPGVLMPLRDIFNVFKKIGPTPRWLEWTVAFICLSLAQFLAYRNARMNLDTAIEEKRQFSMTINTLNTDLATEKQKLSAMCFNPDRTLTAEQHDVLYRSLKQVAEEYKSPKIQFGWWDEDQESSRYVTQLSEIFHDAGWTIVSPNVTRPPRTHIGDPPALGVAEGISVSWWMNRDDPRQKIAQGIANAFGDARVTLDDYPAGPEWHNNPKEVIFWVGWKKVTQ